MNKRQTIACSIFGKTARYLSVVLALTSLLVAGARSQGGMPPTPPVTDTLTEGTTPLGMAPGAPDGSFELSGFDNANLYNGNLNFALPLVHVGGRGSAGMAVTLALNTKRWNITHISCPGPGCNPQFADAYIPTDQPWEPVMPGYGPGVMIARNEAPNTGSCATTALTRLTFVEPDGTEHEFRDTLTHGEPWPVVGAGPSGTTCVGKDRGATFESFDGSAMTFFSCDPSGNPQSIADTSTSGPFGVSGFMTLRDGTTYRIDVGQVQWIRDRNGNVVTCNYSPTVGLAGITDSLGRQVTFTYADQTSSDPHDTITYPGFGGATRTVTVHHAPLASVLRADFPQTIPTYEGLFPSPYIATGQYNPGD
ncbi:MAG TPA: hypothetical protein VJX67_26550, partial [Blastocatellia bacterium]|nr:hypothetical protein [Blastocatellia bacterium]